MSKSLSTLKLDFPHFGINLVTHIQKKHKRKMRSMVKTSLCIMDYKKCEDFKFCKMFAIF